MCDYHTYSLSKKENMRFFVFFLAGLAICSHLFYQNMILLLAFPLLYQRGRQIYIQYLIKKRNRKLHMEFRDFLFSLSTSFTTGRHMTEGMREAELYLMEIYGKSSLLAEELRQMIKAIDATNLTVVQAFEDFARRADSEDIYIFAEIFSVSRETGGNLIHAVNKAAALLSDKINLESEFESMIIQRKLEGRLIASMPFIMILFLQIMSPDYLVVMYTTFTGRLMMSIALFLTVATCFFMERMTDLEC